MTRKSSSRSTDKAKQLAPRLRPSVRGAFLCKGETVALESVFVIVDRPLGSCHPQWPDSIYPVNYGYVPGLPAPDGEEQDVYILGVDHPLETFTGPVIAVIDRADDVEDKWVVAPQGRHFTREQIESAVRFQERYFRSQVIVLPQNAKEEAMQNYLPACKIVTTHGVRGEMKALPLCDGAEFLAKCKRLFAGADGRGEVRVLGVRAQGNMILLRLEGVDDMDAARAQVGRTYYFAKADVRLPKGRYFIDDLLGCRVVDAATGAEYGTLTDVDHPAAQDIYTVTDAQGGTHMLPAVPEFVQKIDLETRTITVTPIDGMFTEAVNGDKE